jgi:hypothetical protein
MLSFDLTAPSSDIVNVFVEYRDTALKLKINKLILQGRCEHLQVASFILNPTSGVHNMLALAPRVVELWETMAPDGLVDDTNVLHLGDVINSVNVVRMMGDCKSFQIGGTASCYSVRVCESQSISLPPIHLVICTHSQDDWKDSFTAMDALHKGGRYILEIEEAYDKNTQILLWILSECFKYVVVRKPATSSQTSSGKFVICTGFRSGTFCSRFKERFCEMALEPLLLGDECPVMWFSHITNMQNYFTKQAEAFDRRVVMVSEMFQKHGILDLVKLQEVCRLDHNHRQYLQEFVQNNLCC